MKWKDKKDICYVKIMNDSKMVPVSVRGLKIIAENNSVLRVGGPQ
jgi:hypothetical protein